MSESPPNIRPPTKAEIAELAAEHHITLSEDEIDDFAAIIPTVLEGYERLDELPNPTPEGRYHERDPGYQPGPQEDPLNAYVRKCHVPGADGARSLDTKLVSKTTFRLQASR